MSSSATDAASRASDPTSAGSSSGVAYPSFVHSLPGGDLIITDSRMHTLHVLSLAGDLKRVLDDEALQFPMGVASDGDVLFVADGLGDCIHSLRLSTGAPLSSVGGLSYPHGLAVAGGTLYVADWGNHRIMTFDRDTLQPLGPIGRGPGEGEGELCYPRGVAVASCLAQCSCLPLRRESCEARKMQVLCL